MLIVLKNLIPIALLVALLGCCHSAKDARKVAVLISAEVSELRPVPNNTEFWHDTVLTYCMLRENGFRDEDIYVLYGDGLDGYTVPMNVEVPTGTTQLEPVDYYKLTPTSGYCDDPDLTSGITDLPVTLVLPSAQPEVMEGTYWCTTDQLGNVACRLPACRVDANGDWRCPVKHIFDCLRTGCEPPEIQDLFDLPGPPAEEIPPLGEDDYLFVWWKGHGTAVTSDPQSLEFKFFGDAVPYATVNGWLQNLAVAHRSFVIDVCHSGCLCAIDENQVTGVANLFGAIGGPDPVILTACKCEEQSWGAAAGFFDADHLHGPWSFWVATTLRGSQPTFGTNIPAAVQYSLGGPLQETFDQSTAAMQDWYLGNQVPQMRDPDGWAPVTRLDVDDPAGFAEEQSQQPPAPRN